MKKRSYFRCFICKYPADIVMKDGRESVHICNTCEHEFFLDLFTDREKLGRLLDAMLISQKYKMGLGMALNVQRGRYGLDEAKRRARLKEREAQGKSVDAFAIGIRRPGSFG